MLRDAGFDEVTAEDRTNQVLNLSASVLVSYHYGDGLAVSNYFVWPKASITN